MTASPWRSWKRSSASRVREKEWPKSIGRSSASSHRSGPMHSSIASTDSLMTSEASALCMKRSSMSRSPCSDMIRQMRASCTSAAFMISPQPERMSGSETVRRKDVSMTVWMGE